MMGSYGTTKAEAARAERDGLPSLLPDSNRWKTLAEDHRWGKHIDGCPDKCPATDK